MCYKMQSIFIIGAYTNQNVLNVHSDQFKTCQNGSYQRLPVMSLYEPGHLATMVTYLFNPYNAT